jgi:hypothetical protein
MPHFGQSPGLSDSTPGHIGQKYFARADGVTFSPWPQQWCAAACECVSFAGTA